MVIEVSVLLLVFVPPVLAAPAPGPDPADAPNVDAVIAPPELTVTAPVARKKTTPPIVPFQASAVMVPPLWIVTVV